jgi:hypothetical protein
MLVAGRVVVQQPLVPQQQVDAVLAGLRQLRRKTHDKLVGMVL